MMTFKPLTMAAIALLAVAAPAYAGKSDAGGEVTLHIEADAAIAPDRAEMTLPLTGKGATRDEALRDYTAKQAAITTALASGGIDRANIKTSEAKDDTSAAKMAQMEVDEAVVEATATGSPAKPRPKRPPIAVPEPLTPVFPDPITPVSVPRPMVPIRPVPKTPVPWIASPRTPV